MTSALSTEVDCALRELVTKSYWGMEAGLPSFKSCKVATISLHANACTADFPSGSLGFYMPSGCSFADMSNDGHAKGIRP